LTKFAEHIITLGKLMPFI